MYSLDTVECFKPILGYESLYHISNHGRVKSLAKVDCMGRKYPERIITAKKSSNTYLFYQLSKDGVKKMHLAHRLVASAFIPNPEDKPCVNHKDGIRTNNIPENLEWSTYSENNKHMYDELNVVSCKRKLTEDEVRYVFGSKEKLSDLSSRFGVSKETLSRIKRRQSYKRVDV